MLSLVAVLTGGCWFRGPGEIRREISRTTLVLLREKEALELGFDRTERNLNPLRTWE